MIREMVGEPQTPLAVGSGPLREPDAGYNHPALR